MPAVTPPSAAYPWQKSAAPHPHKHRAAVRRHLRDRPAVKTMHLVSQGTAPGNGTGQLAVRARTTTITPSCSVTPSMTRDDNRENTIP